MLMFIGLLGLVLILLPLASIEEADKGGRADDDKFNGCIVALDAAVAEAAVEVVVAIVDAAADGPPAVTETAVVLTACAGCICGTDAACAHDTVCVSDQNVCVRRKTLALDDIYDIAIIERSTSGVYVFPSSSTTMMFLFPL